jgi:hypothetical protein
MELWLRFQAKHIYTVPKIGTRSRSKDTEHDSVPTLITASRSSQYRHMNITVVIKAVPRSEAGMINQLVKQSRGGRRLGLDLSFILLAVSPSSTIRFDVRVMQESEHPTWPPVKTVWLLIACRSTETWLRKVKKP